MSPQKFVKLLPRGYTEQTAPIGFKFLQTIPEGFLVAYRERSIGFTQFERFTPEQKIAVRLPDGRLVIPTVKGEKGV